MNARNTKGVSTAATVETPETDSDQESTDTVSSRTAGRKSVRTRCPFCGQPEPGFADSDAEHQPVECENCQQSTVFGQWRRAGQLADTILAREPYGGGDFSITWVDGKAVVHHYADRDAAPITVAVVWPVDDYALMSSYDVPTFAGLVGLLDDLGYHVHEEG
jgi:hypothetical protein